MTEFQLKIADYLITKYSKTGYVYKCIDGDAIKVFNDDGTESIFRVVDGDVKEEKAARSLVPTDNNVK